MLLANIDCEWTEFSPCLDGRMVREVKREHKCGGKPCIGQDIALCSGKNPFPFILQYNRKLKH